MYNKRTAWENQIAFLRAQMNCGSPNIERVAKNQLYKMIEAEQAAKALEARLKAKGLI